MPDLNRSPVDLPDAVALIEELRREIRRRPAFVAIDRTSDLAVQWDKNHLLNPGVAYRIKVSDNEYQFEFSTAVCVSTPETTVKHDVVTTSGGDSEIVCTEFVPQPDNQDVLAWAEANGWKEYIDHEWYGRTVRWLTLDVCRRRGDGWTLLLGRPNASTDVELHIKNADAVLVSPSVLDIRRLIDVLGP